MQTFETDDVMYGPHLVHPNGMAQVSIEYRRGDPDTKYPASRRIRSRLRLTIHDAMLLMAQLQDLQRDLGIEVRLEGTPLKVPPRAVQN